MADRVVLHVGLPKTGTTFVQQLLWTNRESLQTADVHLVVTTMRELFDAARDLTRDGSADWRLLVDAVRQSPGTVVLSCEGLSAVPAEQARRALADLRPADVRVVCTLRDPARVLPSVWQQHVRTGSTVELAAFVAHARDGIAWEWLPSTLDVLDAWSAGLRADQVRLVTVPRSSVDPSVFWHRFATAADLDPGLATEVPPPGNTSLPAVQVELLRRVNLALGDRRPLGQPRYRELVRPLQGPRAVARATGTLAELTPDDRAWAADGARRLVAALRERGHLVLGDLDELLPEPAGAASTGAPDAPSDADVATAAAGLAADLLLALRAARRDGGGAGHPASRGPDRPHGRGAPRG